MPFEIELPDPNVLWSGALGSLVAAIIGGLVALTVVRMTNGHQSRLATERSEKAALAELEASATRLALEYQDGHESIKRLLHEMITAAARWRMESSNRSMTDEVSAWPVFLTSLAREAFQELQDTGDETTAHDKLTHAFARLQFFCINWHKYRGRKKRRQMLEILRDFRTAG